MAGVVMVPLDGSSFGEAAVPQAVAMAARMHATLCLVRVRQYHVERTGAALQAVEDDEAAIHADLDRVAAHARRLFDGAVELRVLEGPVVDALEQFVATRPVDLVVLSTHGRRGLRRLQLGSTADALLHRLHVPMLAVRPDEDERKVSEVTPIAPGCRHVLVGIDGSALGAAMLEQAEALAATWRVPITLVSVVVPPPPAVLAGMDYPVAVGTDPQIVEQLKLQAYERLVPLAAVLRRHGADVRTHVEVAGTAAEGLLAVAEMTPGAILAMATHGYSGFKRLVRGSVTDELLHRTTVPLLIWRPSEAQVDAAMEREAALARR